MRVVLLACAQHVRDYAGSAVRKSIELSLELARKFAGVRVDAPQQDYCVWDSRTFLAVENLLEFLLSWHRTMRG